ncbi:MAG: hypothetical protein H6839_15055 [Planctomycetes bacterium]|nr:hypothetical protein [Planctomycetota bacterium]
MRTFFFALTAGLLLLLLPGCGSKPAPDYSTPEKALATMIRARADNDVKAYADCFVKPEQAEMLKTNLDSPYDEVSPGKVIEEGGFHVCFEEYQKDGKKVGEQPIAFVQEDGNWKASWARTAEYRESKGTTK